MNIRPLSLLVSSSALAGALLLSSSSPVASAGEVSTRASVSAADEYTIDAVHSSVLFRTTHLGVSAAWGRFNGFSGSLQIGATGADCSVSVELDPATIDTANEDRDNHLKSQDFLNVVQFPKASFKSTKVTREGETLSVTGMLSLHGVEKEVSFEASLLGEGESERFGKRIGFEAELRFNRRDFKIDTYPKEVIGDEIRLILAFEGTKA